MAQQDDNTPQTKTGEGGASKSAGNAGELGRHESGGQESGTGAEGSQGAGGQGGFGTGTGGKLKDL
ncbi:MAG TPA: hypothetical protein VGB49_01040 [Caulobacteraceae bacterium]|jgi:hypothetical protein